MPGKRDKYQRDSHVLAGNRDSVANPHNPHNPQDTSSASGGRARHGSSFAARFGRVILAHGIAAIPSALYHYQGKMKLKIQHVWFVSYILAHKWDEDLPYPSLKKMNRSTGVDLRYLQRIRGELCGAGYLVVGTRQREERGQDTNTYDFSGLFEWLENLIVGDASAPNSIREEGPAPDLAELAELDSSFVARYGRIIIRRGVAAVPRAIFTHHGALGLTLQQVWFTTYIFSFQWDTVLPYPSLEKMAEQTGYSRTHLHEIKASLVEKGYLRLIPRTNAQGGRDSNAYDFSGLLDAIRAQLQPQAQRPKAESGPTASTTSLNEIPDLRRVRKTSQRGATSLQQDKPSIPGMQDIQNIPGIPGGQGRTRGGGAERTWGGGQEAIYRGGREPIWEGGPRRIGGGGLEGTGGDGAKETGAGGLRATASVYHDSPRGVVHRRHKEEADNIESETDDSNQISPSKNVSITNGSPDSDTRPPYSAYIAQVISDFSDELHNAEHTVSNVTQALRLWQTSDLGEQEFVSLLYEAKTLTRKYQTRPHWDAMGNKMAYYFKVLKDLATRTRSD
jgi:AraC-like DNA-binding protein